MSTKDEVRTNPIPTETDETEMAPGFVVKRRSFLMLPALTAAALIPGMEKNLLAQSDTTSKAGRAGEVGWEEFVSQGVPVIKELHKDVSAHGQDAYLYEMAHWAARLRLQTVPRTKLFPFTEVNPAVHFGVCYK